MPFYGRRLGRFLFSERIAGGVFSNSFWQRLEVVGAAFLQPFLFINRGGSFLIVVAGKEGGQRVRFSAGKMALHRPVRRIMGKPF